LAFFLIPSLLPLISPGMRTSDRFLDMNQWVRTTTRRIAAPSDVAKRRAKIDLFDQTRDEIEAQIQAATSALDEADTGRGEDLRVQIQELTRQRDRLGARPESLEPGDAMTDVVETGGKSVFWGGDVKPVDADGNVLEDVRPQPVGTPENVDQRTQRVVLAYAENVQLMGFGSFKLDNLPYKLYGMNFANKSNANLDALSLPPKIVAPFLVMILVSLMTKPNSKNSLDRYYAKMKTPVRPDPEEDRLALEEAYAKPELSQQKKLFPGSSLEFQRPTWIDVGGFIACFAACFAIIGLAVLLANIGR
jgi:SSS family solute:Na+ symporter